MIFPSIAVKLSYLCNSSRSVSEVPGPNQGTFPHPACFWQTCFCPCFTFGFISINSTPRSLSFHNGEILFQSLLLSSFLLLRTVPFCMFSSNVSAFVSLCIIQVSAPSHVYQMVRSSHVFPLLLFLHGPSFGPIIPALNTPAK